MVQGHGPALARRTMLRARSMAAATGSPPVRRSPWGVGRAPRARRPRRERVDDRRRSPSRSASPAWVGRPAAVASSAPTTTARAAGRGSYGRDRVIAQGPRQPERADRLVERAVCLGAEIVLGDAAPVKETGLSPSPWRVTMLTPRGRPSTVARDELEAGHLRRPGALLDPLLAAIVAVVASPTAVVIWRVSCARIRLRQRCRGRWSSSSADRCGSSRRRRGRCAASTRAVLGMNPTKMKRPSTSSCDLSPLTVSRRCEMAHLVVALDGLDHLVDQDLDLGVRARLVDEDGLGAKLLTTVDQGHLLGIPGQELRLLDRGVTTSGDGQLQALEEGAVADRAVRDAATGKLLLAGDLELRGLPPAVTMTAGARVLAGDRSRSP